MNSITLAEKIAYHIMSVSDQEFSGISVGTLAYSFNIDRYKLSRQFKRHTQLTLEHFLYREKMSRAVLLLSLNRNITVKEVAKRIGYCTSGYFIQKFKAYYGVGPGKYKELKKQIPH